ncbi:MAG: rod shape-determining protein, partial [Oscillospiraceae bacterium]|nr:rod shape-determining protein [Oscillospiraceae bacterium]
MSTLDIGIDLGTCNILAGTLRRGVMVREPSVIALRPKTGEIIEIGEKAYGMLGRTHHGIEIVRPIEDGVVSDFRMAQALLKYLIGKVSRNHLLKPRVICCVPSILSGVESQSVIDAGIHAGARQMCLIDEPVAAAIGAGMDIEKAGGCMVVDIGGGTSDFAVLSLGGVV